MAINEENNNMNNQDQMEASKKLAKYNPLTMVNQQTSEIGSINSQQSVGMGMQINGFDPSSLLSCRLNDTIQLAFICSKHKKILLTQIYTGFYIPFVCLRPGDTVYSMLVDKLKDYINLMNIQKNIINEPTLVDLLYLQLPLSDKYLCRYTFRCEAKISECICEGPSPNNCQWFLISNLNARYTNTLWGPEPILLLNKILGTSNEPILWEVLRVDAFKYLHESMMEHPLGRLFNKIALTETHLEHIFLDYISYTFPSIYMTRYTLEEFVQKSELISTFYNIDALLQAWMIDSERGLHFYIDFDEFLFGLFFMSTDCLHQSPWLEIRCSYIFHYYSRLGEDWFKDTIKSNDLITMCNDIEAVTVKKSNSMSKKKVNQMVEEMATFFLEAIAEDNPKTNLNLETSTLNFDQFLRTLIKRKNRYLTLKSFWCTTKSVKEYYETADIESRLVHLGKNANDLIKFREERCYLCREKPEFRIAEHTIKIMSDGSLSEVYSNEQWINSTKRFSLLQRQASRESLNFDSLPYKIIDLLANSANEALRSASSFLPNPIKLLIRNQNKIGTNAWSMGLDQESVIALIQVVNDLGDRLLSNKRTNLLFISSPTILLTDLNHMSDLFQIEQRVSSVCNVCSPVNYVLIFTLKDLRRIGIELLLFWIANKSILPDKFFMVFSTDNAKKEEFLLWLGSQCESITKGNCDSNLLMEGLLKIITYFQRPAIIDYSIALLLPTNETVYNAKSMVEEVDKQMTVINELLKLSNEPNFEKIKFALFTFIVNEGTGRVKRMYVHSTVDNTIIGQNRSSIRLVHNDNRPYVVLLYSSVIRVFYIDIQKISTDPNKTNKKQ